MVILEITFQGPSKYFVKPEFDLSPFKCYCCVFYFQKYLEIHMTLIYWIILSIILTLAHTFILSVILKFNFGYFSFWFPSGWVFLISEELRISLVQVCWWGILSFFPFPMPFLFCFLREGDFPGVQTSHLAALPFQYFEDGIPLISVSHYCY